MSSTFSKCLDNFAEKIFANVDSIVETFGPKTSEDGRLRRVVNIGWGGEAERGGNETRNEMWRPVAVEQGRAVSSALVAVIAAVIATFAITAITGYQILQ